MGMTIAEKILAAKSGLPKVGPGDIAEIEFEQARARNVTRGTELAAKLLPESLLRLVQAGGVYRLLEQEGLIAPGTGKT